MLRRPERVAPYPAITSIRGYWRQVGRCNVERLLSSIRITSFPTGLIIAGLSLGVKSEDDRGLPLSVEPPLRMRPQPDGDAFPCHAAPGDPGDKLDHIRRRREDETIPSGLEE
jgi:hypothetical protein